MSIEKGQALNLGKVESLNHNYTLDTPEKWARYLTSQGVSVFPTQGLPAPNYKQSKAPVPAWAWTTRAATDSNKGFALIRETSSYGVNLRSAGLVVIDDDNEGELDRWCERHGVEKFDTFTVKTNHGYHYYFDAGDVGYGNPSPFKKRADGTYYDVDVRGNGTATSQGGYVLGAGSRIWGTDNAYEVENPIPPQPMPRALHEFLVMPESEYVGKPRENLTSPAPANKNALAGFNALLASSSAKYVATGIERELDALRALQTVPEGVEPRWDNATFSHAARLIELANHPDSPYNVGEVERKFMASAPTCSTFGRSQHEHKWQDALERVGTRAATIPENSPSPLPVGQTGEEIAVQGEKEGEETHYPRRFIRTRPYSEIEIKQVGYVWKEWIPAQTVTLIAGGGGSGKSMLAFYLANGITHGTLDGIFKNSPAHVLYFGLDDATNVVSKPRALVANVDIERFHDPDGEQDADTGEVFDGYDYFIKGSLEGTLIRQPEIKVVILDPVSVLFDGKTDDAQDVERFIHSLRHICERRGVTIIMIAHTKKGGGRGNELALGSTKWRDSSRCMILAAPTDTNETVITVVKTNYKNPGYSLKFEINEVAIGGLDDTVGYAQLLGVSDIDAEALVNRAARTLEQEQENTSATEWLKTFLTEQGDTQYRDIAREGKAAGFTDNQLRRAREKLKIRTYRMGGTHGTWVWGLPEEVKDGTPPVHDATFATFNHDTPIFPHDRAEKLKMAKDGKTSKNCHL